MRVVHGDLISLALAGEFDVVVHGCNCQCVMGAGLARQIKRVFPEAYSADLETKRGDRGKLGSVSVAAVKRGGVDLWVVNAYTQFRYGHGVNVDYGAIRGSFREVRCRFDGFRVGYPRIGAGLGGGDWGIIEPIIEGELEGMNHALVELHL